MSPIMILDFTRIKLLLIGVFCLAGCLNAQVVDPCSEPLNIIGDSERSTTYVYEEVALCDYDLDESLWYSFKTTVENTIPELETVPTKHCGTFGPIFIKAKAEGTYHEDAKNSGMSTPEICSNYDGPESPCDWSSSITILYCPPVEDNPEFYLYKLVAAPSCDLAYCAGTAPTCNDNSAWNDATQTCESLYPVMTRPTLVGPVIVDEDEKNVPSCNGNNLVVQRFAFYCDVGYEQQATDDHARFVVQLVFNDVVAEDIVVDEATSQNIRVEISETLLIGNLGKRFSCQASSYWNNAEGTGRSGPLRSDSYWLQIQLPSKVIDLNKPTGVNEFTFKAVSSLPITCWHCANIPDNLRCECCGNQCSYSYSYSTKLNSPGCTMMVLSSHNNGTQKDFLAGSLQMQLEEDAKLNQNQNYMTDFQSHSQNKVQCPKSIWEDYQIPSITIQTIAKATTPLTCVFMGDPHVTNIKDTLCDNFLLGDFVLASVIDNANHIYMMIQTRQFTCYGEASCNCGVIVREGNSILGIDACINAGTGLDIKAMKVIRYLETKTKDEDGEKTLRDGANIFKDASGKMYTILMASGMRVEVHLTNVLNIYVTFPPKYNAGNIQGMCAWTDFPAHKGERYRVPKTESMFVQLPQCLDWNFETATDCTCKNGITTFPDVPLLPLGAAALVKLDRTALCCKLVPSRRRRRQAPDESPFSFAVIDANDNGDDIIDIDEAFVDYPYDPDHGKDVNPTWPTATGKTEQQVVDHCRSVLGRSGVYEKCQGLYDEEAILTNCKLDVQISDDLALADPYMEHMQKLCLDAIIFETNATSRKEVEQDPNYSDIANNICPTQCNQRGTCQNGACTCNEGFAGADCSVSKNDPPELIKVLRNGTCDLSVRKCAKLRAIASNIYDSATLTCRFETFPLIEDQDSEDFRSESFDTLGAIYTFSQIDCPLPESKVGKSTVYRVSISNDGVEFSNDNQFYVYDPTCLTRADDDTWQLKESYCLWNGACYPQSSPNCPVVTSTEQAVETTKERPATTTEPPAPPTPATTNHPTLAPPTTIIETEPTPPPPATTIELTPAPPTTTTEPPVVAPVTTVQTTTPPQVVTTQPPTTTAAAKRGEGFDCDTNNPCTLKNILLGKLYFPCTNPNQYVKCSLTGKCSIVKCLLGAVWNVHASTSIGLSVVSCVL